jgi:hypothetical protein
MGRDSCLRRFFFRRPPPRIDGAPRFVENTAADPSKIIQDDVGQMACVQCGDMRNPVAKFLLPLVWIVETPEVGMRS